MTAIPKDMENICSRCIARKRKLYNCPFCMHSFAYENRNTIINQHKNFKEVIYYKQPFPVTTASDNKNIDRTANWHYIETSSNKQILVPKSDNVKIKSLLRTLEKSRKHSQDNFFGFAFNNNWDYFVTLTLDPKKVQRENDDSVKYAWKLFRQKLQYFFSAIKILIVIEMHKESKGLHFHGLLGNCNLDNVLVRAVNNKKYIDGSTLPNPMYQKPLYTTFGDPLWNFIDNFYTYGFTSIVKLHEDDNGHEKMVQYMQKYMTKEQAATKYHKRSFFRTHNLDYKEKFVVYSDEQQLRELLSGENVTIKKENDKIFVAIIRD